MRILVDGFALVPPRAGIGHYTDQLIRALATVGADHEYLVLYPHRDAGRGPSAPLGFPEANVRVVRERWSFLQLARVAARFGVRLPVGARVGPVDVFHAPNYVVTRALGRARLVVTIHDLTLLLFPEWHPPRRVRQMARELARAAHRADRILADSAATRRDIVARLGVGEDRVTVVPLAADASFRPLDREVVASGLRAWGLDLGGFLLFLGTLEPRKNLGVLLDALERAGPALGPLVVAGADGWLDPALRRRLDGAVATGRVRRLGYVPDEARPVLMNGARLFVYPSRYEGFGLPPLEAMACGTPVITSGVSSLPEVVGDAALLVDPGDADALADAMVRVWSDGSLRDELAARGVRRAAGFSWARAARATLEVYRELCG